VICKKNLPELYKVLQLYDRTTSKNKTKSIAMEGRYVIRVNALIDGKVIEYVISFRYGESK
jgi:hypothetical protein